MSLEFTDQNFEQEVINAKEPVLVDFWAAWCGPCQMLKPIIDELAKDNKAKAIKIGKLDVDANSEMAQKYQVMSIPTIIFFKDGKPVNQLMGVQSKDSLQKEIDNLI
ncbi:MAG: thioredoxin [Patescibacteria group bacterium]